MMLKTQSFLLMIAFVLSGCSASKRSGGNDGSLLPENLKPFGRTVTDRAHGLELISSASNVGFSFRGASCKVFVSVNNATGHNYIQYELDGIYQKRISVSGVTANAVVISATGTGPHRVWIYKATEAHTGPVFISKIEGRDIKALERPSAPVIEFIGNSITCGAVADPSETPCGTGEYHDQHNAYAAYGPRVARALKANFILSSVSGIGVYRNWNSEGPAMPEVYDNTDFQKGRSRPWNFSKYSPRIVSIALGTNDFSKGDGKKPRLPFDSSLFVRRYISFVQLVISKYPSATIALLSSPMIGARERTRLEHCLTAVKGHIDSLHITGQLVALHFFAAMQPHGCSGHPDVEDHAIMARELVPFFQQLL